jgi:single-strand DNA-binding protein
MSNNITLIGNLTMDPELRFTPSGVAMARIGLAVNRRYQKDGEWQEQTSFFYGTVWREQAEHVAESLQKGARVIVSGRMEQRTWRDKEDQQRESIEVVIDEIGPSLRWATASVNRTERSGGDWSGGGGGGGGGGEGADVPPAPVARESYGPDEAPF